MAVPEYPNGRVIVPASEAYTNSLEGVHKKSIPFVNGIDVTKYTDIPNQVDYFFNIPTETDKYITNFNENGYGLLHLSTSRLQSRKLFSWGNNDGSDRWQEFLTKDAGRYLEIQAGLAKTQYGCLPMAPNTAWEWIEQYGPIQVDSAITEIPFEEAVAQINSIVSDRLEKQHLETVLKNTRTLAKKESTLCCSGSGYAALENMIREHNGECKLSPHLDFGDVQDSQTEWKEFLQTKKLRIPDISEAPSDFMAEDIFHKLLIETIETTPNENAANWYAHYHLGLSLIWKEKYDAAKQYLLSSNDLQENPWALHALSVLALKESDMDKAADFIIKGLFYQKLDLSYLKEGFKILLITKEYNKLLEIYETLPEEMKTESRIYFDYLVSLSHTGNEETAYKLLTATDCFEVDDLRECEDSIGDLWSELHFKLYGTKEPIPHHYNFSSFK